jgi:hypothetical protein
LVHALVTIFLLGLWLPVWILVGLGNATEPYRCTVCGTAEPSGHRLRRFAIGR